MENIPVADDKASRKLRAETSYREAFLQYSRLPPLARIPWCTWGIAIGTIAIWCFTAYQAAVAGGAHNLQNVLLNVFNNAINIQDKDNDALTKVLTMYGAKDNSLIHAGQYWRFVTPIFLHANLLHVGLNMLNFVFLGVMLERLAGHLRFLLIYLVTGVVSIIASFVFAPQEISIGASGAIFGLVGAYSLFMLVHRQAFPRGGIPALTWLIVIVGGNLSIGLFIPNVDNYAHVGGLLSGCLLGWWFMPRYTYSKERLFIDVHSLARRWPLAVLTLIGTLVLAIIALFTTGG